MIGALVAILSLNLTASLVQDFDVVAGTLPITGATVTTPITVTSPNHGVAPGFVRDAIVSGVVGTVEANGLWRLSVVDANTFSLSTFSPQGIPTPSVGVHPYISGGQIQYAFPDGSILLGRSNVALASAASTPRIVFVPTDGKAWNFESYAGAAPNIAPAKSPPVRGSLEQQSMALEPQKGTEYLTFEVYVSGTGPNYGNALSPNFYDLDATQALVFALWSVIFDATGQRAKVLHESWPSQSKDAGTQTQRGQQWMGVIEFQEPVTQIPKQFVPVGVSIVETVEPVNAGSSDATIITILQKDGP
jgi:hypothetical protein